MSGMSRDSGCGRMTTGGMLIAGGMLFCVPETHTHMNY
jgi:hypothetical protein